MANEVSNDVSVIDSDANTVDATVEVGDRPRSPEYNPSNEHIYVANALSNDVFVIDSITHEVISTVEVGNDPVDLEYNPTDEKIYTANLVSGNVSVIDSVTYDVSATVEVGDGPASLEYNPSNGNIYVANQDSDDVSVIESSQLPSLPIPDEGIIGSGNTINIQVQNNEDNIVLAQDGNGFSSHSDQSMLQEQSTNQDSNVASQQDEN